MRSFFKNDKYLFLTIFLFSLVFTGKTALAGVSPGDIIDQNNYQKIQGMVPESVLKWVEKGDFVLHIDSLNFDPKNSHPLPARKLLKTNINRYSLDDNGVIVDARSGENVFVEGIPFPIIDLKDPRAPIKILYNCQYCRHCLGDLKFHPVNFQWVSRKGLERSIKMDYLSVLYTGAPYLADRLNPTGLERSNIFVAIHPFDIAGTAVMLWRYNDSRRDNNYSYVPAIRRVRRMTPASRSDAFMGSDFCMDDTASYDGKITDFTWKIIGTVEGLQPWMSPNPLEIVKIEDSKGYKTTANMKKTIYGFESEDWQGAPWAPLNIVWVKRKMVIVEGTPKDPYYNYGKTTLWFDAETFIPPFKIIYDRAEKYWKTGLNQLGFLESEDGFYRDIVWNLLMIDDRNDHATQIVQFDPKVQNAWYLELNLDDFSLGGFQKYCK